jgi:hypothetical protein
MSIEYQRNKDRDARGTGNGLVMIVVLLLIGCYLVYLYPGAIREFGNVLSLLGLDF